MGSSISSQGSDITDSEDFEPDSLAHSLLETWEAFLVFLS